MQLGAFAHLGAAELRGGLEPRLVGAAVAHQCVEVAHLEGLGEVLVVVERLRAARLEVEHLQVEALGAGELLPERVVDALRYEGLVRGVDREGDEFVDEGGLVLHPRADGLARHVAPVDSGVAGERAQGRGVPGHLDVGVLEDVLVAVSSPRACWFSPVSACTWASTSS